MAVRIIGNDYNGVTVDADSDIWIVQAGATLAHTAHGLYLADFDYSSVHVDGTIGARNYGIASSSGSNGNRIVVSQSGSVTGRNEGIDLYGDYNAIINHGTVTGHGGSGIEITGIYAEIANSGSVFGYYGIFGNGAYATMINTGTVMAGYIGIAAWSNGGVISNSGTVQAKTYGVYLSTTAGASSTLNNSGTIAVDTTTAAFHAVVAGVGDDTIVNTGQIIGNVALSDGNDTYDGRGGTLTGEVLGGTGNDTYIIDDASTLLVEADGEGRDTVRSLANYRLDANFENLVLLGTGDLRGIGNAANNTITGNAGDNLLRGHLGKDRLNGADGDDRLFGGNNNDTLNGGTGDDALSGGRHRDTLNGGAGDDTLRGEDGNDRLNGGADSDLLIGGNGADRLNGGAQNDTLRGGGGYDTFIFAGSFGRDVIEDFHASNKEKIDLSGVSAIDNFTDLTSNHMSQAGSDVRIDGGGGNVIIIEDFNVNALSAGDFIF